MVNKFMKMKTWQKLSIGIAILTILKMFTMIMNGFIIDVKAEESNSCTRPTILIGDVNTGLVNYESFNVKEPYRSNYLSNEELNNIIDDTYIFGIKGLELNSVHNNVSNTLIKDKEINTTNNIITTGTPNSGYTNYIDSINFTLSPSSDIDKGITLNSNTEYTLLFEIGNDGQNDYNNNNYYDIEDVNINISLTYQYENGIYVSDNYNWYDIQYFNYETPGTQFTCPEFSYIQVKFKTKDLISKFTSDNDLYYLKNMEITLNNTTYNMYDVVDLSTYNYFYKNETTNGELTIENIYIIMDGDLVMDDNYFVGGIGTPLDKISCQSCNSILDIECQINRILCYIESFFKNIIYNLRIMINNIFVPDKNTINGLINTYKVKWDGKFAVINSVKNYLTNIVERFNDLEPKHTIDFTGIKLPNYDGQNDPYLIPPFVFNFDTLLENPTIALWYGIYLTIAQAFIIIGTWFYIWNVLNAILYNTRTTIRLED